MVFYSADFTAAEDPAADGSCEDSAMHSRFTTSDYVQGLTAAGFASKQVIQRMSEDGATVADLEKLKVQIDAAAARAEAELQRFRILTCVGILLLCATILLLHFSRT